MVRGTVDTAAPTHHLQKVSSHGHHGCHLPIKLIHSWFLWMTGQSGQCSLVELPHHPGLPAAEVLKGSHAVEFHTFSA